MDSLQRSSKVNTRSFLGIVVLGLVLTAAVPAPQADQALSRALGWLEDQQLPDGGYSNGYTSGSDVGTTADVVLAVTLAGQGGSFWETASATPGAYLEAQVGVGALNGPGIAAKVALAALALGRDPRDFGGADLLSAVQAGYDSSLGLFGGGTFDSALCVLALSLAGDPLPEGALDGIRATRLDDGSYAFNGDTTPGSGDSNTTALVVQALAAAGASGDLAPSLEYFRATQNADGGWTYQKPSAFGEETDANSTALVIQALVAAGETLGDWGDPIGALLALQGESGALAFNASTPGDNMLATTQAIPALAGVDFADLTRAAGEASIGNTGQATAIAVAVIVVSAAVLVTAAVAARRRGQGG
jgi:hypothetical protein